MGETAVGIIEHYFPKAHAAVVFLTGGSLKEHDTVHIVGGGLDIVEPVTSLQLDNEQIHEAHLGERVGLRVDVPVPRNAKVFRVVRD